MKRFTQKAMLVPAIAAILLSCGGTKGRMTIVASADHIEACNEAFGRYFDIGNLVPCITDGEENGLAILPVYDSRQFDNRYLLFVNQAPPDNLSEDNSRFLIAVHDIGSRPVKVTVLYTSGAVGSKATVINRNLMSGKVDVTATLTVTVADSDTPAQRFQAVAAAIHHWLIKTEGK
jgi:hypothetical protein